MNAIRIYICGPMAGKPNQNREAFDAAAEVIRARGAEPLLPHDILPYAHDGECVPVYGYKGAEGSHDGGCYLRGDIASMVMCDSIYRLKGWQYSLGALAESQVAELLMIPIEDEETDPTKGKTGWERQLRLDQMRHTRIIELNHD